MNESDLRRFNDAWLDAWTNKDVDRGVGMYAEDCRFMDSATAQGLSGRKELRRYLEQMFPVVPTWRYRSDELWPIPGGFCARWFCDMDGGRCLRGFDFVQLREGNIVLNEVYTHDI